MSKIDNVKGLNRLTKNAKRIINDAFKIAEQYGSETLRPVHLFVALLQSKSGVLKILFDKLGMDVEGTVSRVIANIASESVEEVFLSNKPVVFSDEIKGLINESFVVSSELNQVYVGSEHLFLAFLKSDKNNQLVKDLQKAGLTYKQVKSQLVSIGAAQSEVNPFEVDSHLSVEQSKKPEYPSFVKNMNTQSLQGMYPNITGRDTEIKRLVHILSRKTKNNPIIVGDAGVGKTAIVEGFVNALVSKNLPSSFFDKKVLGLDIAGIVAGARLRGDVEERINSVINQVLEEGNNIIFIDEIHTIVGAGAVGSKDSLDIANILKPYLTDSSLSVIGATTYDEYRKFFESDSALSRRFQPIFVEELSEEAATIVLQNLKKEFEFFHGVKIQSQAIDEAVILSKKFIKDRYLPDKAIDIIDEGAASIKIGREIAIEPELSKLGEKLIKAQDKKFESMNVKNFEAAAKFKAEEERITDEIEEIIEGKKNVTKKYPKTLTPDLVRNIIVDWTKIPIAASDLSDKTLKDLEKNLKSRIIGQDHVVKKIASTIQRTHLGLRQNQKRPLASFLFLGPTGIGKTELAKQIAKELFGSVDLIHQVNMSEFMEQHSVAKMIGSPPGYVGYQEGGALTNFVRRKPYSVILFDELEKAHPDILNIMLQILEEGELKDAKGVSISFSNTIVIMTSNIGAEEVSNDSKLGFDIDISSEKKDVLDEAFEEMRDGIMEQLKNQVRPEFLNRFDSIEVFRGLNKVDTFQITKLNVDELKLDLLKTGIMLETSPEIIELLNEQGYSKEFGGRNIRRKIQELLENGLAEFLIGQKIQSKSKRRDLLKIEAAVKDNKIEFAIAK